MTLLMLAKKRWESFNNIPSILMGMRVTRLFSNKVGPYFVDLRERLSLLNSNAQENIEGNRVVKAFAQEAYEIKKFDEKNLEVTS